jgi:hypothetical protein
MPSFALTKIINLSKISLMEEKKVFWSISRRKYLAGKLGELSVILVAGGILSDIFTKLSLILKISLIIFAAILLLISIPLYPEKEEER